MAGSALTESHWALVIDTCGITTAGLFAGGVAVQHVSGHAAVAVVGAVALTGLVTAMTMFALHDHPRIPAVIGGWTLLAAGWLTYAHVRGGVWSWLAWQWLAAPAVVLTAVTAVVYHQHLQDAAHMRDSDHAREDAAKLAWWSDLLEGCGIDDVRATRLTRTDRGRSVTLALPVSGRVTLRTLQAATDSVAAALRVQPGALTFQMGRHSGEVVLRIDEPHALSSDIPYPDTGEQFTINSPLPIGILPSGLPATVMGSMSTLVTGVTGAGKTNLLNVVIAALTSCPDVVVIVIDLKGGRLAAPWIRPWVEGRCPRPAVDWVATTRAEAGLVLAAVDDLITHRSSTLTGGAAKVRASRDLPQVVVLCDEMADVTGDLPRGDWNGVSPRDLAELGAKTTRKCRSEGAGLWWATQRGTIDFTGSSAIKSQCKQRLSLATASETDARSVTDNQAVVRLLAGAPYPGVVVIEAPGQRDAVLTKVYRLDGDDDAALIDRLAERAGHSRPEPDAGALQVFGDRYANRWTRSDLYQLLLADFHARTGRAPLPAPPTTPHTAPPPGAVAAVADLDVNQEAAELFAAAGLTGGKPDPEGRMWALLADRPTLGLSVIEIMWALDREGLGVHRSTVYRWLNRAESEGKVRRSSGDGDATRWVLTGN